VVAPLTVKVATDPEHIVAELAVKVGVAVTFTAVVALFAHPAVLVPTTV
jgi:hypothetical protein